MLDAFGQTQNACGSGQLDSFLFTIMNALTIGFEYLGERRYHGNFEEHIR
ncbi:MAG: hypothetical protein ACTTJ4_05890 [Treponema sp.]